MLKMALWKKMCLVLVAVLMLPTAALAVDYESYSGFVTSEIPVLPEQEQHPKLWFDQAQAGDMYQKRNADDYAAALWNSIAGSIYLSMPLPAIPSCTSGSGQIHAYYGDMARIAKYNAFMYAMEGAEMHKTRAIEALMRAYDGPIYDCAAIDPQVSSSPIDETYRANWAQNFAAAYDWVQPALTAEQDAGIRTRLAFEAQMLSDNLNVWGPRPHNHRSKPAWGVGSLALAMSSHPSAAGWLEEALKAANTNTKYFFSSDGVYREGSQYYIYSHINFVPFLYHYKNVSGVDNFRVFKTAFEWEFYVSNAKGWMPNFADSYLRHNFLAMTASQFMTEDDATPLHPGAKWGNLFQWRYQTTDTSPWGGEFGNNTGASYDDTMDLDKYLTYDPTIEPIAPAASGTVFLNEGGQTIFRNNWNVDDPNSRYLLFQGVAEADNHNHFDHLSFVIHAQNQMMASDSGYSRSAYGDAERRTWYRTAPAHNTVTLNGQWPVDFAENETPPSKYSIDTDFFDFQQKEARYIAQNHDTARGENPLLFPPDSESLGYIRRAIAFPGQDYFVIADQFESKDATPRTFAMYLHGGRGEMLGTGNFRQWTYGNDLYGTASKLGAWVFSNGAAITDHAGELSYIKDDYRTYGYIKAEQTAPQVNWMQVLVPLGLTDPLPRVTDLSDAERVGGTVEIGEFADTYLLQQGQGEVALAKAATDGDFAYVRDNGPVRQYSVRQATRLSYAGEVLFKSSARVTAAVDLGEGSRHRAYLSTDAAGYSVELKLPYGKMPASAVFGGSPVAVAASSGFAVISGLDGEGELVVQYEEDGAQDTVAPSAIDDLAVTGQTGDSVSLRWTATGNDGGSGTAAYYDLRYSLEPIAEQNWDAAPRATNEPTPRAAGGSESMTVSGLTSGTSYYFAIRAVDAAGNRSPLSNTAGGTTDMVADVTPPAKMTSLAVTGTSSSAVTLQWSAPGDDEYTGTASSYDIRYSPQPITEDNWAAAVRVNGAPAPQSAMTVQTMTAGGLLPGRSYFFAIKSEDEAGNVSPISNLAFATLEDGTESARLEVVSVQATEHDGNVPENVLDGDLSTRWSALSAGPLGSRTPQSIQFDLGTIRQVDFVKIAFASGNVRNSFFDIDISLDNETWIKLLDGVQSSGLTLERESYELGGAAARYVRLTGYGNTSSGWNSVTELAIHGKPADAAPPLTVGSFRLENLSGERVTELAPNELVKVKVHVINNIAEEAPATLIVALYNPDHSIDSIAYVTKRVGAGSTDSLHAGFVLPSDMEGHYIKAFVWDTIQGMRPLSGAALVP